MDRFDRLTKFLDSLYPEYSIPGCDCALALGGETVYRHMAGYADLESKRPVSARDTYWIYSAGKLFTVTAALRLLERGLIDLDAPVSRYLPEFADITVREGERVRPAKGALLVRHLLNMTGGLDYELDRPAVRRALREGRRSTRKLAAALAEDPFGFDPGEHFAYSLCHDVLGAVLAEASGMPLSELIRREITEPMGMEDTTFFPTGEQLARLSTQYLHLGPGSIRPYGQHNKFRFSPEYESGGAGLMSTVDDYMKLITALSLGGRAKNGYVLLRPESVKLMSSDALGALRGEFQAESPATRGDYSYGLGVRVRVERGASGVPAGEFGWDGYAGAYCLVDPANELALFFAEAMCESGLSIQILHPKLRDTVYDILSNW